MAEIDVWILIDLFLYGKIQVGLLYVRQLTATYA